ncbi:hypothetical protein [Streptomyces amritsarensis]|uniref:hypothetical protein n=1 Tax=Streptomyces amritsarensis TaxID=681158 RepID=UPI0036A57B16
MAPERCAVGTLARPAPSASTAAEASYPRVPWQDTDEAAWNYFLDVNLTAHYRTCHAVTPA